MKTWKCKSCGRVVGKDEPEISGYPAEVYCGLCLAAYKSKFDNIWEDSQEEEVEKEFLYEGPPEKCPNCREGSIDAIIVVNGDSAFKRSTCRECVYTGKTPLVQIIKQKDEDDDFLFEWDGTRKASSTPVTYKAGSLAQRVIESAKPKQASTKDDIWEKRVGIIIEEE